jgi:hypothetical protein
MQPNNNIRRQNQNRSSGLGRGPRRESGLFPPVRYAPGSGSVAVTGIRHRPCRATMVGSGSFTTLRSGSTARLWAAAIGQPVGEPLRGHEEEV